MSTRARPPGSSPSRTVASPTGTSSSQTRSTTFSERKHAYLLHHLGQPRDLGATALKWLESVLSDERDRNSVRSLMSF